MSSDSKTAAQLVMKGYNEVAASAAVTAAPAAAAAVMAPQNFCNLWPKAKPVLQLVVGIIGFLPIPGGGIVAGGILNGLITLGDQIYEQTCK